MCDAVKCFDKLWLSSCIVELYKAKVDVGDIYLIHCLNKESLVKIRTSVGETDFIWVGEMVKQGSVLGTDIACLETDAVNRIGELQRKIYAPDVTIGMCVHVDDMSVAGDPEDIKRGAQKLRMMEEEKKFTFGIQKTKYMVIKTGREKEKKIQIDISSGTIGRIDEYKLLGFWINEMGNCMLQVKKNGEKVIGKTSAVKSFITPNSCGSEYINVRLKMFECCLIPSLLYGIEAWNRLSKNEYEQLEKKQGVILRRLLYLPRTTPYYAILCELGIWKIKYRIYYRKIMLLHNIMHSDDHRTCKKVILAQKESEEEGSFFEEVKIMIIELGIEEEIAEISKSNLKKEIKERIDKKMTEELKDAAKK